MLTLNELKALELCEAVLRAFNEREHVSSALEQAADLAFRLKHRLLNKGASHVIQNS